ncbi:hypothetical protein BDN70DRAFT_461262 [Pholiota conissans]|uniref:Fungal-type protein kinase domain-containing protein n=1 Tax=Pholiota conissans TaxID=109636 RepID=A0A9P5ZDS4_9AGAR|nr:hypothetical protein BDN70DRAFT_461262 [Pholiota conissans]
MADEIDNNELCLALATFQNAVLAAISDTVGVEEDCLYGTALEFHVWSQPMEERQPFGNTSNLKPSIMVHSGQPPVQLSWLDVPLAQEVNEPWPEMVMQVSAYIIIVSLPRIRIGPVFPVSCSIMCRDLGSKASKQLHFILTRSISGLFSCKQKNYLCRLYLKFFDRRVCSLLTETVGKPLSLAHTLEDMLDGLLRGMLRHYVLYSEGWLHGNVTNDAILLLASPEKREEERWIYLCSKTSHVSLGMCTGMIINAEHTTHLAEEKKVPINSLTHTMLSLSIRLTQFWECNSSTVLCTAINDLESFLWIFLLSILERCSSIPDKPDDLW